jgi:predicted DNA-binding protein
MLDDDIRIRIPEDLKQRFKDLVPNGKMTDLLKGIVIASLEGVSLSKIAKKPPAKLTAGAGVRTKYYQNNLQKADGYIRFLIDKETKERFKLVCFLQGTTMSDFLREAVEDILREEAPFAIVASLKQPTPVPLPQVSSVSKLDMGEMWNQMFGSLCA